MIYGSIVKFLVFVSEVVSIFSKILTWIIRGQKDTFAPPTELLGGACPGCPPKSTPMTTAIWLLDNPLPHLASLWNVLSVLFVLLLYLAVSLLHSPFSKPISFREALQHFWMVRPTIETLSNSLNMTQYIQTHKHKDTFYIHVHTG